MSRIGSIVRENNDTFYNYSTGLKEPIWGRIFLTILISAILTIVVPESLGDFLNGIITVQSILIGFSFSVMFFLVAGQNAGDVNSVASMEAKLKSDRLGKLSKELFHNLSYFNLTAIACLLTALVLLLPDASVAIYSLLKKTNNCGDIVCNTLGFSFDISAVLARFSLYLLALESGFTFARTVGRVNYLFEQKMPAQEVKA